MKILFDARPLTIPSPGGVTRLTRSLLHALAEALPTETFYFGTTGQKKLDLGIRLPPNSQQLHLGWPNKCVSSLTSLGLRSFEQFFSQEKPDLLILPNNGHVGFPKIPYGLIVHDLSFLVEPTWFNQRGRMWHKLVHARRVMTTATRLFAVSDWTKFALMLHLGIPAEKIDVLPIPRQPQPISPGALPDIVRGKRYVLCLGRQDTRKNARCVVEAVKQLHTKTDYQDLHLVIVGGHSEPISDPRFIVLPRVSDEALYALYRDAAAFLYPSWYEGLGLPLHEAALFGTPSIASSVTALPDTAPTGTLFASPAKPQQWTIALQLVLENTSSSSKTVIPTGAHEPADWQKAIEPMKTFILDQKRLLK